MAEVVIARQKPGIGLWSWLDWWCVCINRLIHFL